MPNGALLLLVTFNIGQVSDPPSTAENLLKAALDQRRAISRAAMTVRVVSDYPSGKLQKQERIYRFWMDGDRTRKDVVAMPVNAATATVSCQNCEKDGHYVIYEGPTGHPKIRDVIFGKLGDKQQKKHLMVVDPRILGVVFDNPEIWYVARIDSCLGVTPQQVSKMTVERGRWKDYDCHTVVCITPSGKGKTSFLIVPALDHSVARMETEYEAGGVSFRRVVEADLRRFGNPGVWFPQSLVQSELENGALIRSNTIDISEVSLNEPIPADVFQMIGMNIPVGTEVKGSVVGSVRHIWNGVQIQKANAPQSKKGGEPIGQSAVSSRSNRTPLLIIAGVLSLVAAGALILARRRRQRLSRPDKEVFYPA